MDNFRQSGINIAIYWADRTWGNFWSEANVKMQKNLRKILMQSQTLEWQLLFLCSAFLWWSEGIQCFKEFKWRLSMRFPEQSKIQIFPYLNYRQYTKSVWQMILSLLMTCTHIVSELIWNSKSVEDRERTERYRNIA